MLLWKRILLVLCLSASNLLALPLTPASASHVINNIEEKVNGEGPRNDAGQQNPDISSSGWVVWWDTRGSATTAVGNALWSKDLNTRAESRVTELSTPVTFPRVAGDQVVWEDISGPGTPGENRDVFARQLPSGPVVQATSNGAAQGFPAIDATMVVWEDFRNFGTTGVDIFMRDLTGGPGGTLGPEIVVTQAPGDQRGPEISGDGVVWTDFETPAEPRVKGRNLSDAPAVEFVIADPAGVSARDASVSEGRVVWREADAVKTCVLGASGCASASTTVWASTAPQGSPHVSGSRVVWLEPGPDGRLWTWHRDLSVPGPNLPARVEPPAEPAFWGEGSLHPENPKIDGSKLAWTAQLPRGTDIYWKDATTSDQPTRANSLGLGGFPDQGAVAAGPSFVVFLANSEDFNPRNSIWATDLSGDRRNLRVSTFADFGSAISPPRISGNRVVWSDFRDGNFPPQGPNVFFRDLPAGNETRMTTSSTGNFPDTDADRTAWICEDPVSLCVHRDGAITRIPLNVTAGHEVWNNVRIYGTVVLWSEFQFGAPPPCCPGEAPLTSSKIHAVDVTTGEDSVLGSGAKGPTFFPEYDISGTNVAWRGDDASGENVIYRNTTSFPCAPSCDRSASATQLFSPGVFNVNGISMDGTNVAWTQDAVDFTRDVWLKDVNAPTVDPPHRVTTNGKAGEDTFVLGDFVYWSDSRDGDFDIYRESISGTGATLPLDTTPPAAVTGMSAGESGGSITVTWTNPSNADLMGVIILRKTGTGQAATSIDDPSSTIVFDGLATSFRDTDVVPGVAYTYTAFAYDEVPNYSARASTAQEPPPPCCPPPSPAGGYRMVAADGGIFSFGGAGFFGSTGGLKLNSPIVGMASTPTGKGYWFVASDGGIFSFGDAAFFGSTGKIVLNRPIVGIAATPSGEGYWMVARDGGIFAFGDAAFFGSTGGLKLNSPIVGMASTPTGKGYWFVASDGGIFSFGDAAFFGSTGAIVLNRPIVGIAATPSGKGYWMVASDGGIFTFGDAGFFGSAGAIRLASPIVGIAATPTGRGYWLVAADGGIFTFGDAGFLGSIGGTRLVSPIVGIASS